MIKGCLNRGPFVPKEQHGCCSHLGLAWTAQISIQAWMAQNSLEHGYLKFHLDRTYLSHLVDVKSKLSIVEYRRSKWGPTPILQQGPIILEVR